MEISVSQPEVKSKNLSKSKHAENEGNYALTLLKEWDSSINVDQKSNKNKIKIGELS